jgi:hypothetical protein
MLLQCYIILLGSTATVAQQNELLDWYHKLEARITAYEPWISIIIKLDDNVQWSVQDGKIPDMDSQLGGTLDDMVDLYPDRWYTPEKEWITLPSALAPGEIERLSLQSIKGWGWGQVTDSLEGLCLALGKKSLCFWTEVCNVKQPADNALSMGQCS